MKISKKDIQLLTAFAGILIAVCAYFFVYQNFVEKTEVLNAENKELSEEVTRLEMLEAKKDVYISETEKMKSFIGTFENRFPADILPEDSIMIVKNMEDATDTIVSTISFGGATEVVYGGTAEASVEAQAQSGATEGEVVNTTTAYADSHLYELPLGISIQCSYEDFKGLVRYIYAQQDRMSISGVNVSYDASNNQLSGNMTLNTYYLLGTEKMYSPVEIPDTRLGVNTIFGNID